MTSFLNDRELGPAIRRVMKGAQLQCAVAFWGNGAARTLFKEGAPPHSARIVCELMMGGTNPGELRDMGAPSNENIKHLPGLHAKVYISDQGLIICSANASNNGIGFVDHAKLLEAGTFHKPATEIYDAALRWFEEIWVKAKVIDDSALLLAQNAWTHRPAGSSSPPRSRPLTSLLDAVIADPKRFQRLGFTFTTASATTQERDETAEAVVKKDRGSTDSFLSSKDHEEIKKWPVYNVFSNWNSEDIDRWPRNFVNIHQTKNRNRISYTFYERAHVVIFDDERGSVLARRPRDLRQALGFTAGVQKMADLDSENASYIFDSIRESGPWLFANGKELARLLMTLRPWR